MWGCLLSTWIDPETIGKCRRCEWARESLCHMAALKPRKDTGDLRNRSNLLDAQQKDTMITMEWLHPLSFPWLKQELTSAFWRQTPLYLGIDFGCFSKRNPETEAFDLIGWLVFHGSNGVFRLPSFKDVFFPCSGSMVCHRSTICPGSGASVCSRVW